MNAKWVIAGAALASLFFSGCGGSRPCAITYASKIALRCDKAEERVVEQQGTTEEQDQHDMRVVRRLCNEILSDFGDEESDDGN